MGHCKKCGAKIKGTDEYCAPCQRDNETVDRMAVKRKSIKGMKAKK